MSVRKLRAGRAPAVSASQYVGEKGTIFWNESTGELRLSDGHTAGGFPLPITLATETTAGTIKLGPGVTINGLGQLIIDTAGLDFSFGDFYAFTNPGDQDGACLSSVNANQDINIVSNGTGQVNVVGEFHVHTTDDDVNGALSVRPVLSVSNTGYTRINVPVIAAGSTGLLVNGSTGDPVATTVAGVTFRAVGNDGMSNTVAFDAHGTGAFASVSLRSTRGVGTAPTATKSGDVIGRITGVGYGLTGFSVEPITNRAATDIRFVATEDFTDTRSGTRIEFYTSPNGGTVKTLSATITSTGITANVTGNVSGNAGTVTHGVYTTDTGTVTNTMLAGSIANNKLANSTISGIALGSNLAALTIGTHLTGTSYNGSTGVTIATDATTDATPSVLVARDGNGMVTAQNYKGNSRNVGTLTAGATLTIDHATDHHVFANITGAITIAHVNITAGRNVKVVLTNATGGNLAVTSGTPDLNTTGNSATANLNANRMGVYEFISFGTTTTTLYCSVNK